MNVLSVSKAINSDQVFVLSIFLDVKPSNKTTKKDAINTSNIYWRGRKTGRKLQTAMKMKKGVVGKGK